MKLLLGIFLLLLSGAGVMAQTGDKAVEKIRAYYDDIAARASLAETDEDRGEFGDLVMNELVINSRHHQWRAIGIYGQTYKFFYHGGDTEEHMYPDQLVMVKVERRESNRNYAEEYLYSDAGDLMFYFQKAENDDQVPTERRVYFSGAKTVLIVEDNKTRKRPNAKDSVTANSIRKQSRKIRRIFIRSITL